MIINHNIAALNTYNRLASNTAVGNKALEKLSSGLRINRAGDDAAGLAISEKMRGQIRGLDMAAKNAQDGISLIQTAEGALNETHSILQRMRELAVQSASDTNTDADRLEIQKEVNQLIGEIDRIGDTTEFNTKKLINGGASVSATVTGDTTVKVLGGTGDTQVNASVVISTGAVATKGNDVTTATFSAATTMTAASSITINGTKFDFTTSNTAQDVMNTINNANVGVKVVLTANGAALKFETVDVGTSSKFVVNVSGTGSLAGVGDQTVAGTDATIAFNGLESYQAVGNKVTVTSGNAKGLSFELSQAVTAATTLTVTSNGTLNFQIGANENQEMNISIGDMRSSALGVASISVSSQSTASASITTIQTALERVSAERAKLGAYQNRLEHTINNLGTSSENLSAAESRIRDVDMAKEMMNFTKTNILSQAATAMLAQANQQPQGVLQLLR